MEREDEELLAAIANDRDRDAFRVLFDRYASRLKGFFIKAGASHPDDLVQEVLLTAWAKAGSFDSTRASAATWLFTIARNRMIDRIRKERRPKPDPNDPAFVPPSESTADKVDRRAQAERVRAALGELPPEQAEVLRMSYFKEISLAKVAAELELPLGTVKSRARIGIKRLRAALGGTP